MPLFAILRLKWRFEVIKEIEDNYIPAQRAELRFEFHLSKS